jgi:hypothetical protein
MVAGRREVACQCTRSLGVTASDGNIESATNGRFVVADLAPAFQTVGQADRCVDAILFL